MLVKWLCGCYFEQLNKENKDGIIRRSKGDKSGQHYNFPRNASLDNKYNLLLSNVTPEDSGTYECFIGANVGGQNRYLQVNLTVQVCVTSQAPLTTLTTMTPDNTTESALACSKQAEDLPVLWTVSGCVAVGLGKIILCLISIWVFHICSSRQQREWWHWLFNVFAGFSERQIHLNQQTEAVSYLLYFTCFGKESCTFFI